MSRNHHKVLLELKRLCMQLAVRLGLFSAVTLSPLPVLVLSMLWNAGGTKRQPVSTEVQFMSLRNYVGCVSNIRSLI